ncbi:MAG: glycine--tRNA ligase subunit beta [Gallionella sp.]
MSTKSLLVELFVEELPPKSLKKLGECFAKGLSERLISQGLALKETEVTAYATPRRLAVLVESVSAQAADKPVSQKLMPVKIGLDAQDNATPALLKKLATMGVDASVVVDLNRKMDGKSEALYYDSVLTGVKLVDGLQWALNETLAKLPIAKVMTYPDPTGDGWETVNFVRPAHRLIALHGRKVVPVSVLGLSAGNSTQGHRFEAACDTIVLEEADSYARQLKEEGAVIACFTRRRAEILDQLQAAAAQAGYCLVADDALLDEVTALVELPNVLVGTFESEYLKVPQECLILTMKSNQKYFPLVDAAGKLSNQFLIVSNIKPDDASWVIKGNERVVRPRLADAKFFYDQDRKRSLDSRVIGLSRVVYHNKLGTLGARVARVQALAGGIARQWGDEALARQAEQAARLAKADLLTDMVGEFPELQGIMGRYYAQFEGLPDEVAYAIEDHYKPRFSGDTLPRNLVGICVALADKLETLVGMFGIGQIPTGDKDPFALRRHALGIIRLLVDEALPLSLTDLIKRSFAVFTEGLLGEAQSQVETFIFDRLGGVMREQNYTANEVEAVLSLHPQRLSEIPQRLAAVRAFAALPEAASLAAANKRVGNILRKSEGFSKGEILSDLLHEPAEQAFLTVLIETAKKANAAYDAKDYTANLQALAVLKEPVDHFFNQVMVNVDNVKLRTNRLRLLLALHELMNRVADLSKLAS